MLKDMLHAGLMTQTDGMFLRPDPALGSLWPGRLLSGRRKAGGGGGGGKAAPKLSLEKPVAGPKERQWSTFVALGKGIRSTPANKSIDNYPPKS